MYVPQANGNQFCIISGSLAERGKGKRSGYAGASEERKVVCKMNNTMYDVAVIGAGVTGSAIARELSRYQARICVLEKGEDVCTGTSKANSAIVHGGFDAVTGSLKAKMNVLGNEMMTQTAQELDIPFKRNGALVLCFDEADKPGLQELYDRGVANGVKGLKILTREEAKEMEPNLSALVCAALYCPSSGIVCPFELTLGFAENAADNGAEFFFESGVTAITKKEDHYEIETEKGVVAAKSVVNAAGIYADAIHDMACPHEFTILPRAGEYCLCDKTAGGHVTKTIFQMPSKLGKGILVTPTVHGNLLLGPTASDIEDREFTATTREGLDFVLEKAALSVDNIPARQIITSFSGLRAHDDHGDFILQESAPGFFDAAGIESPGLTSAPAIGKYMAEMVAESMGLEKKDDFNPIRHGVVKMNELPEEERAEKIRENPLYGNIICRCETISEGEIMDAIHRTLGATTLDGVKRRTRAGMGRCQSGFCSPRVMDILARELDLPLTEVRKNGKGSEIVFGKTK